MCIVSHQSPINIRNINRKKDFHFRHNYRTLPTANVYNVLNNGRTIKMALGQTDYYLEIGAKRYKPVQAHIHLPSEHTLGGERYPAEVTVTT